MNSTILLTAPEPALKLNRPSAEKWAAALAEERRRLLEDQEQLREREENLRRYEARLRSLQEEIEAGRGGGTHGGKGAAVTLAATRGVSRAPFGDETALMAGWEKLHRARELLEAEQAHLREDRLAIRDQEQQVKKREMAVAAREQALAAREAQFESAAVADAPVAGEHTLSAVTRLTRVPFDMARSVFGGKK